MFAAFFTGLQKSIRSMHRSPSSAVQSCCQESSPKIRRCRSLMKGPLMLWALAKHHVSAAKLRRSATATRLPATIHARWRSIGAQRWRCPARNVVGQYEPSKKVGKHLNSSTIVFRSDWPTAMSEIRNTDVRRDKCDGNMQSRLYRSHS